MGHRLHSLQLLEFRDPLCIKAWIWQFLRDRRARVDVNGIVSSEGIYRAGLPQGSVLSPALFLLWSASLAVALQEVLGATAFMYADDTAARCAWNTIEVARWTAQVAADALTKWAQEVRWGWPVGRPRR